MALPEYLSERHTLHESENTTHVSMLITHNTFTNLIEMTQGSSGACIASGGQPAQPGGSIYL